MCLSLLRNSGERKMPVRNHYILLHTFVRWVEVFALADMPLLLTLIHFNFGGVPVGVDLYRHFRYITLLQLPTKFWVSFIFSDVYSMLSYYIIVYRKLLFTANERFFCFLVNEMYEIFTARKTGRSQIYLNLFNNRVVSLPKKKKLII